MWESGNHSGQSMFVDHYSATNTPQSKWSNKAQVVGLLVGPMHGQPVYFMRKAYQCVRRFLSLWVERQIQNYFRPNPGFNSKCLRVRWFGRLLYLQGSSSLLDADGR